MMLFSKQYDKDRAEMFDKVTALEESIKQLNKNEQSNIDSTRDEILHKIELLQGDLETLKVKTEQSISDSILHNLDWKMEYCFSLNNNSVYKNNFEFEFLKERWAQIENYISPDAYGKLTRGMDTESARLITRFLNRVRKILSSNGEALDLYEHEEMAEMYNLRHIFPNEIVKLDDNAYGMRGWILPIDHFEKGIFIDCHGINKMNTQYFENKDIIDVGAYIGDSACILSQYTKKRVFSFEALNDNFALLKQTIDVNNLINVQPVNYALGNENGSLEAVNLYEEIANGSCCTIKPSVKSDENTKKTKVNVIRLDDFVKENNISCGLIKVDIEGAEQDFLMGAENTIKEQKPSLIMSIYHSPDDFFNIKPLLESWVPEYKFQVFKPIDGCAVIDTVLLCEVDG